MKIIFLLLFIGFSLEDVVRLSKYSSRYVNEGDYVFLDLSDFSRGDTIYLEVYFYSDYYDDRPSLPYRESNTISESDLNSAVFNYKYSYDYEYSHSSHYYYYHENYYKIKLETNSQYLVLKINFYRYNLRIKHARSSHTSALIIVLCVIIAFVVIAVASYLIIRKILSKRARESVINEPLAAATTAEPLYIPSPGFDPTYNQAYYTTY